MESLFTWTAVYSRQWNVPENSQSLKQIRWMPIQEGFRFYSKTCNNSAQKENETGRLLCQIPHYSAQNNQFRGKLKNSNLDLWMTCPCKRVNILENCPWGSCSQAFLFLSPPEKICMELFYLLCYLQSLCIYLCYIKLNNQIAIMPFNTLTNIFTTISD